MKVWSGKIMHGKSLNGYPFRIETNVNAKVVGPNRELKQNIDKHNMATANLTEGVVKFLRGEFTESYISGLLPNIGNDFNAADQYIPAYMGMGVAGVTQGRDSIGLTVDTSTGFAPSYADTALISEVIPVANPGRAVVNKSVRSNAALSQAASLILSTAYHFEDRARTQTFSLAPSREIYAKGTKFYLSDSLYPGKHILQRINSIDVLTSGWTYQESTDFDEEAGIRPTGILYYTQQVQTGSGSSISEDLEVLSVDFNTGEMVIIAPEGFAFTTGLDITYDPVNFDFIYANDYGTVPFIQDGLERTYYISELGLFSGDIRNEKSKLLARVMLDPDTPLKISEGDYVLITWQIGVYALDDSLYEEDIETGESTETSSLKYLTQEEATTLVWSEITELDADGNPIEQPFADILEAVYKVLACDFSTEDTALITVDNADGLHENFPATFNLRDGQLTGTVTNIAKAAPVTLEKDWIFNPRLVTAFGTTEGLFLSNLIYCQYLQKTVDEQGYFEYDPIAIKTQTGIEYEVTGPVDSPQMAAIKTLMNADIIKDLRTAIIEGTGTVQYIKLNSDKLKAEYDIDLTSDILPSYVIRVDTSTSQTSYEKHEFMYLTNYMTLSNIIDGHLVWQDVPEAATVPSVTLKLSDITRYTNKNIPEIQENSFVIPVGDYWEVSSHTSTFKFPKMHYLFMNEDSIDDLLGDLNNGEIYYTLADIATCTIELPSIYYDYQVEQDITSLPNVATWDESKYTVRVSIAEDINKTNKRILTTYVYKHIPVDGPDGSYTYYEYPGENAGGYRLQLVPDNQIIFTNIYKSATDEEGETVE